MSVEILLEFLEVGLKLLDSLTKFSLLNLLTLNPIL